MCTTLTRCRSPALSYVQRLLFRNLCVMKLLCLNKAVLKTGFLFAARQFGGQLLYQFQVPSTIV